MTQRQVARAARFVTGIHSREASVTDMINKLGWQSLENRRREARLVLLYKVVHGLVAVPHQDHINFNKSRTRAKNPHRLQVHAPKTDCFKHSFFPRTTLDWNNLGCDAVLAESVDTFKAQITNRFD